MAPMRRCFLLLCFACLAFWLVGCGPDSSSSPEDLPELMYPSEDDAGSSSSEVSSSSEEKTSSSSAKKNNAIIAVSYGKLLDERDSAVYRTVTIGEQSWMAENLNYETEYSFCYGDSLESCEKYGRLYYWSAAMDSTGEFSKNARGCGFRSKCSSETPVRGVCPEGWHLPSVEDVRKLAATVGGMFLASEMLRSTDDWVKGDGVDMFGFSGLPSGLLSVDGAYLGLTTHAFFWTSNNDNYDNRRAYTFEFEYDNTSAGLILYDMNGALSVRCLKDELGEEEPDGGENPVSSSSSSKALDKFTDSRDDQEYKTVTIGEQVWMAQNLNYECKKSYCYGNSFDLCDKYGRLYDWSMAQDICPEGWHLPDTTEWNALFAEVGGRKNAGTVLRSNYDWSQRRGSDVYGFSALPGGYRDYSGKFVGGSSRDFEEYTFMWTAEDVDDSFAYSVYMTSGVSSTGWNYSDKKDYRSVRCVRDEPASSSSKNVSSSSSSGTEKSSSSSIASSSSEEPLDPDAKYADREFLWDGMIDTEGRIETGSPDRSSGLWYDFNDRKDGGTSKLIYPSDVDTNASGNFFGPLIEAYGGIMATASFGEGFEYPYVGLAFDIWSENQEGANIARWNGLCLSYVSSVAFTIELVSEKDSTEAENHDYKVTVPATRNYSVANFQWEKFSLDGEADLDINDALKKMASIKLKFEGEPGTSADFRIEQIGSVGSCDYPGLL